MIHKNTETMIPNGFIDKRSEMKKINKKYK